MPKPAKNSSFPFRVRPRHEGLGRIVGVGAPLIGLHVALLAIRDLAAHLTGSLLLLALGFAVLVWAGRRLADAGSALPLGILCVAALLRLSLLPLPPTLSDDVLRYVWDGRVAAAGFNPYRLAPEAEELADLRDDEWLRMPHREVPAVYPPLAIGLFSIAARLPSPILFWKVLLAAADLGTCAWLLRLAAQRGLHASRVIWYAWNPLVVLEVAGMGHVDALGVAGAVAALTALSARPPRVLSGAAAAVGGILAKLGPLPVLPLWGLRSGRPLRFLGAAGLLLAAFALPVLWLTGGVPPGLVTYGVSWEFNGPIYEPLWRALEGLDVAGRLARGLDAVKEATRQWESWNWIYPYLYPQLLAKLLLGAGMLLAVARSLRDRQLLGGTGRLFGALLLLSATLYPWYLLWILPWAALALHPAWLALSALSLLSYIPQGTPVELFPGVFLAIWVPFWVLLYLGRRRWSIA